MIRATASFDGPAFALNATVSGLAVYLDNWAVIDLAEGDTSRRRRFIEAICTGGDLLFSVANAAELAEQQGASVNTIKTFLDELGPHWYPVELNAVEVVQRELDGKSQAASCLSQGFMRDYFNILIKDCSPSNGKLINLSDNFFHLGAVLDWVGPERDSVRELKRKLDESLKNLICKVRPNFDRNPLALKFNPSKSAVFTSFNLVRILMAESGQLKPGDGLDFSHAVMGSAFASVAALDKPWKRRIQSLPKPNGLAYIYSAPDLNKMVADIELWVKLQHGPTA
jgi:hypothetical protein